MKKMTLAAALAVGLLGTAGLSAKGTMTPGRGTVAQVTIAGTPLSINVGDDNSFQVFNSTIGGGTLGQIWFGALNRTNFSTVSETVSTEIARNATLAVLVASIAILIYISLAFRSLPKPWLYGSAAIVAVLHDAFIILGIFAFLGEFHGTEVDTAFITAILTVIGFSVHDTIVVFDRIRETLKNDPYIPFEEAVNASMTETLARSINTSLVVVLTVLAMMLIGGDTIRNFLLVLLVGVVSGTYSSIGIASQLVVAWENDDLGKFMRRIRGKREEDLAAEAG